MEAILQLHKRAKKLTPIKVRRDLFKFIRTLERELAQYNKSQLFADSEDVEGNPIGFYSQATELITKGRKKAGQPFNLYESGKFLGRLFAKVEKDSIFFDTKDSKRKEVLTHLLSANIFGLTDKNLNKIIEEKLLPFMIDYYLKYLKL